MANNKIIHLATLSDANDAVNKSCVDTNNFLKTVWTNPMAADLSMSNWKNNQFSYTVILYATIYNATI